MVPIEHHPLKPFLPEGCRILFLGSFPPQRKRWSMEFFYPNYINDHWRIEGIIFFGNKNHFVDEANKTFKLDEIICFLNEKGIGFYDTATAVRRLKDNASDKFLEVVEHTDIEALLEKVPMCQAIVVTGEKAAETICQQLNVMDVPKVGQHITITSNRLGRTLRIYRLPSSSRAYPLALNKKADAYRKMYESEGIL